MSNETIVDRVVARLKQQPLGDLITEEDLHDVVKTAIPKVFFEQRWEVEGTGYHQNKVAKPPLIFDAMKELLQEDAKKAVKDWIADNSEMLAEHWKKVLDAGIEAYVKKAQEAQTSEHVRGMLRGYFEEINRQRQAAGQMPIHLTASEIMPWERRSFEMKRVNDADVDWWGKLGPRPIDAPPVLVIGHEGCVTVQIGDLPGAALQFSLGRFEVEQFVGMLTACQQVRRTELDITKHTNQQEI